jgi:hypothetical protein
VYSTRKEYLYRLGVFSDNMNEVRSLNAENSGATFGATQFSDWTKAEFEALLTFRAENDILAAQPKSFK